MVVQRCVCWSVCDACIVAKRYEVIVMAKTRYSSSCCCT